LTVKGDNLLDSMTAAIKEKLLQLTVAVETAMLEANYSSYRRYVQPAASFFEPRTRGTLLQVEPILRFPQCVSNKLSSGSGSC